MIRRPDRSTVARLAGLLLTLLTTPAASQTVVELQAGGTSLYDSYGLYANVFSRRFESWVGVGYQDGFRFGAGIRTGFDQDTLSLGSDVVVAVLPTDVFSLGINVLAQDVRYTAVRGNTTVSTAVGWAAETNGSQFFRSYSFDAPFGSVNARHRLADRWLLGFAGVISGRQTALASVQWLPLPSLLLSASGGIGSNEPYTALSAVYAARHVTASASYVWLPSGRFQRVDLPYPVQSEANKGNLRVEYEPWQDIAFGAGLQNFLQDSGGPAAITASGVSAYARAYRFGFRTQVGLYDSRSQGISNFSNYFGLGRSFGRVLDVEGYLLQSRPSNGEARNTPIVNLRERLTRRFSLMQQFLWNEGALTVQFGGDAVLPLGDVSVSYQLVQQPFAPEKPFKSVLNLTARLQLGRYSTSVNTSVLPDGSVNYLATASTFLYLGQYGGLQPNAVGSRPGRFVLRGRVLDQAGLPVEGAAIALNGELAFTNAEGQFMIRVNRLDDYKVEVRLDEFLLAGAYEVLSTPATIRAERENRAQSADIILRRTDVPPPPPDTLPPDSVTEPPS
ncbi:MAG: carboxypeptidase-like regulatory domain-containing protein [Gemmatimonadales bacterium]